MLMLEHKGISYRAVNLPTGLHPLGVRLFGFPGTPGLVRQADRPRWALSLGDRLGTVPALRIGGERVQTNREIARFLERRQPEPSLFPADPELRREVEEAERWGDEVFQMAARRAFLSAVVAGPDGLHGRAGSGRLGPLLWRSERLRFLGAGAIGRMAFGANPDTEGELLADLPPMLDRIDAWIDAGVLNAEALNAADFMIVTSLALLDYRRDLRPDIAARPANRLLGRVLPG
jgi:glutathione S-transferase